MAVHFFLDSPHVFEGVTTAAVDLARSLDKTVITGLLDFIPGDNL
jgi:hypothetical protein